MNIVATSAYSIVELFLIQLHLLRSFKKTFTDILANYYAMSI